MRGNVDKFRSDPRLTLVAFVGIYFPCQDASALHLGLEVRKRRCSGAQQAPWTTPEGTGPMDHGPASQDPPLGPA